MLTVNIQNRTILEFANTVCSDEMAQNEPSHLDLQCFASESLKYFQHNTI